MHTIEDAEGAVTIEPDAFFGLEDARLPAGENRFYFFLEADQSTEAKAVRPGSTRFHDKFLKYSRYFAAGGHTKNTKSNISGS
jgi:hypothetical protein